MAANITGAEKGKGNNFTLNDFINEPDIIDIDGKQFKLRDLTITELIRFQNVFNHALKVIKENAKPVTFIEKLFGIKRRDLLSEGKTSEDFQIIKTALDICNPDQPFLEADFNKMTRRQISALQLAILERNYFLDQRKLVREVVARTT